MRRRSSCLAALLVALALPACGGDDEDEPAATRESPPPAQTETETTETTTAESTSPSRGDELVTRARKDCAAKSRQELADDLGTDDTAPLPLARAYTRSVNPPETHRVPVESACIDGMAQREGG